MTSQMLGPYQVIEVIGEGGMGQVLKAFDPKMQRQVAIKVVHPALVGKGSVVARSQRELQVLVSLEAHPNIVRVFDYVSEPFAIVMELLQGRTLDAVLAADAPGGLPTERLFAIMRPVVDAVGFAHEKGILHRDLKSANVMIVPLGTREVVKVMDFGLAGFVGGPSGLTRTGTRMGTPAYMAPEQHLGRAIDERTDIYSLGVLLFEACTGRLPFPDSVMSEYELARAHIEAPLPSPRSLRPDLSPSLEQVIIRATQKAPEHRYPTCSELAADLDAVEKGRVVSYGLGPGAPPSIQVHAAAALPPHVAPPPLVAPSPVPSASPVPPPATVSPGPSVAAPPPQAVVPGPPAAPARQGSGPLVAVLAGVVAVASVVAVGLAVTGGGAGGPVPPVNAGAEGARPAAAAEPAAPAYPACRSSSDCRQQETCHGGRCLTDWWCLCYTERDSSGNVVVSTGCRRTMALCDRLQQASAKGGRILVENGVVRPCTAVPSEHPGDVLGGRAAWIPSEGGGGGSWQAVGRCLVP